jgi:hypothetical protein
MVTRTVEPAAFIARPVVPYTTADNLNAVLTRRNIVSIHTGWFHAGPGKPEASYTGDGLTAGPRRAVGDREAVPCGIYARTRIRWILLTTPHLPWPAQSVKSRDSGA